MSGVCAVILAGGSGTRFWPMSRRSKPKQFLSVDSSGRSLLTVTADRIAPLLSGGNAESSGRSVLVVTTTMHADLAREHLPASVVLAEPVGRNTAASIGLAAFAHAAPESEDPVMIVLPSDHVIEDEERFRAVMSQAVRIAQREDVLVTLGIAPSSPHTGYGYIKAGPPVDGGFEVAAFVEKPELSVAQRYLEEGGYFWNSGMFVWRRSVIQRAIETQLPSLAEGLRQVVAEWRATGTLPHHDFAALPSISIDYGVLEKVTNRVMVPAEEIGWNDVGSFEAWAECFTKDSAQNVIQGDVTVIDAAGCIVKSEGLHTAVVGLTDTVVIVTHDAVLVCSRDHVQQVRGVVDGLTRAGRDELL